MRAAAAFAAVPLSDVSGIAADCLWCTLAHSCDFFVTIFWSGLIPPPIIPTVDGRRGPADRRSGGLRVLPGDDPGGRQEGDGRLLRGDLRPRRHRHQGPGGRGAGGGGLAWGQNIVKPPQISLCRFGTHRNTFGRMLLGWGETVA